jgi:lipopolysaccharide/colanic/teichoic acid biosynthesis glycosyltransferase
MSAVADIARLGWDTPAHDFRWQCRPGLTGLAQLLGARADEAALVFDRVHAQRWRFWLDCQLIAWSFAVNMLGKRRIRRRLTRRYGILARSS